jgi:hypothetical protein
VFPRRINLVFPRYRTIVSPVYYSQTISAGMNSSTPGCTQSAGPIAEFSEKLKKFQENTSEPWLHQWIYE